MDNVRKGRGEEGRYEGQYIAYGAPGDNIVIASGRNSGTVIDKARKQGVDTPTIVFVPKSGTSYLY